MSGLALRGAVRPTGALDPWDPRSQLVRFEGTTVRATFTENGGGHFYEGGPFIPFVGDIVSHPNELMNPGRWDPIDTTRHLISTLDALVLAEAYGYTVRLPTDTFLISIDPETEEIELRGDPQVVNDLIRVEQRGSDVLVAVDDVTGRFPAERVSSITIDGAAGNDRIELVDVSRLPVVIDAGAGADDLRLLRSNLTGHSLAITAAAVVGAGEPGVAFEGVERVFVEAGRGNETIRVLSTNRDVQVSVSGGAGNDEIHIGSDQGTLDSIQGPVVIDGGPGRDTLLITDIGSEAPRSYTVDGASVRAARVGRISYRSVGEVLIQAGGSDDDTVVGGNDTNDWRVFGTKTGQIEDVTFIGIENIKGGSGPDRFAFEGDASISGSLRGGGGGDKLSYAKYARGVAVQLDLGSATGVDGGVSGIENIVGSPFDDLLIGDDKTNQIRGGAGDDVIGGGRGNDVLLGDDGNDIVDGGAGRNILVTGRGLDELLLGTGENIAISDSTVYDDRPSVLMSLLAEWKCNLPIDQRIRHLRNGTGLTDDHKLHELKLIDDALPDTLRDRGPDDWVL